MMSRFPAVRAVIQVSVLALLLGNLSCRGASAAEPILSIVVGDKTRTFTAAEFSELPRTELETIEPHEKKARMYSGVAMRELLLRAGAPLGDKLRGPALTLGVLIRCKDQYTVLYALAEFDENFSSRTILLADREDSQPPPATAAPLRLVAPGDKRGARWARMVTSIELVSLPSKS
jgi:hypothetical protein